MAAYDPYHPENDEMKEVVASDYAEVNQSTLPGLEPVARTAVSEPADWGFSPKSLAVRNVGPEKPWQSEEMPSRAEKERKVCGLGLATLVLAIALAIVLLAAAVGGGVGGSMAANTARRLDECQSNLNQQRPPQQPQPPSPNNENSCTNKTVFETGPGGGIIMPTEQVVVELNCPAVDNAQRHFSIGSQTWEFRVSCGVDYRQNDVGGSVTYTLDDCLRSCAAMNYFAKNTTCRAVTFNANLTHAVSRNKMNCFLKSTSGNGQGGQGALVAGATLAGTS